MIHIHFRIVFKRLQLAMHSYNKLRVISLKESMDYLVETLVRLFHEKFIP